MTLLQRGRTLQIMYSNNSSLFTEFRYSGVVRVGRTQVVSKSIVKGGDESTTAPLTLDPSLSPPP